MSVLSIGNYDMTDANVLTDRFDQALLYATHVHGGQVRKGTSIPYIAHLLAVAATVLEYDSSEDMAIAALLHDAVEDQCGGPHQCLCIQFHIPIKVRRLDQDNGTSRPHQGVRERQL
jgi:hypothetical protein